MAGFQSGVVILGGAQIGLGTVSPFSVSTNFPGHLLERPDPVREADGSMSLINKLRLFLISLT
jgi:hypothetical protein